MFYISLVFFMLLLIYNAKGALHMAQQNLYNDDNRYLKWKIKDIGQFKKSFLFSIVILLVSLFIYVLKIKISNFVSFLFIIFYIVNLYLIYIERRKNKVKLKFKVTSRVKRLIITNLLILSILCFILYKINNYSLSYFILFLYYFLIDFIIMISIIINKPIEKLVYLSYKNKALNKLNSMSDLKVIGITGSYGKTSSKNILSDILNVKYNALASPKNFNTPYGLIITVNNYLDKFDDILIAEMGAYKVGEIKQLCDLVKPKYGILTKIGTAHIEIFGSQENIQRGKFELIESLPSDGIGVLNKDDALQVNYNLKNDCKIIWIGIDNETADVRACDIKITNKGTTFNVIFKGDKNKYEFTTKLFGYNNIYNILASLALAKEFGISIDQMKHAVLGVKAVEHRLEFKDSGNITYIDDSYNSNPDGSKMALDVLSNMPGERVIMTPGMVELGNESYRLNKEFGMYMKEKCDIVVLVGKKITKPIMDGLKESGFNEKNIYVVNSTDEAFNIVKNISYGKKTYCLIENDLPDIYNE